ncbi:MULTISPECIES: FAD-dependent monooxygenase [unclassified Streptomyces]|uniref:FAD-dependent monooxygenase n=1 Tax=unclassified Streptomyces TaxID=2593676 RepID=UPI0023668313|nr:MULTISPECIES: FAD-dependent monooxygenase [unclassified Streptomyces]MDF3145385.1 FAD-dependent monooxygenase [Streptomyces sp. T21Q-yed]WDF39824.1 FAD-dependent monooxygenase [Streptomyces sp. T12]
MPEAVTPQGAVPDADVIVVGAGPVGLMLACELALAGTDVLVLERAADFDRRLRAPGITARSIEALDRRGLLDPLMEATARAEPAYRTERAPHGRAPEMLPVRAGILEEVLYDCLVRLGGRLERGLSVTGVTGVTDATDTTNTTDVTDAPVVVTATDGDGRGRAFRAAYVVGCDGGRSAVRKALGVGFPGGGPEVTGYQAVVTVEPEGALERTWSRTPRGIAAYALGPSRIVSVEFDTPPVDRHREVTLDEVEASLRRTSGVEVTLSDPVSLARFTGNCRLAERYRRGRVFLAGDAAHVHPPFGGQGLNLGLQDAVNLGWKLAAAVRGDAPAGLLDSYESERRPVAARVLRNSEAATRLLHPGAHNNAPYELFFRELMTDPAVKQRLHDVYAMKDLIYPMGGDGGDGGDSEESDLLGRAAPDLLLERPRPYDGAGQVRLATLQRAGRAVLVHTTDHSELPRLAEGWRDRVDVVAAGAVSPEIPTPLLIRPDGYVAWACGTDPDGLTAALHHWFGEPAGTSGSGTARAA